MHQPDHLGGGAADTSTSSPILTTGTRIKCEYDPNQEGAAPSAISARLSDVREIIDTDGRFLTICRVDKIT